MALSAIVRKELKDRTVLFRSLRVNTTKAGYGNKRAMLRDKNPEKRADSGPFFMDGLVQHFRWGGGSL